MVFIAGPSGSGKTVFGVGLYKFIAGEATLENDTLDLASGEFPPSIDDLYAYMLKTGRYPKATAMEELRLYRFKIPRLIGEPISVEFVDYRGELLRDLPNKMKKYKDIIAVLSKFGDENFIEKVKKKILRFDDIKRIEVPSDALLDVVYAYLISQVFTSDKLIFLIDGKKLLKFLKGEDVEIVDDLNIYKRCVTGRKDTCFVVTKADELDERFEEETGKTRIDNKKGFIKWIDRKLAKDEDTKIPSYVELKRSGISKIFATSVKPVKYRGKTGVNVWGFEEVKKWIESTSLLGDRLL